MPEQPIFYPVLNLEYAEQIASRWNTKDSSSWYIGIVTSFQVDSDYLSKFETKIVGAADIHQELWVPAEELSEFNKHIVGKIKFVKVYYGQEYCGKEIINISDK